MTHYLSDCRWTPCSRLRKQRQPSASKISKRTAEHLIGPKLTLSARVLSKDDRVTNETHSNAAAADPRSQAEEEGRNDNCRLSRVHTVGKNSTRIISAQRKTLYTTDARGKATIAHSASRRQIWTRDGVPRCYNHRSGRDGLVCRDIGGQGQQRKGHIQAGHWS